MDDLDEIRRKLQEAGIPSGGWTNTTGGRREIPPTLQRQKDLLGKLGELIQFRIDQDKEQLAKLHETLNRVKHGGGS